MKPHTRSLETASNPTSIPNIAHNATTRSHLEQRLLSINTKMAALTPDSFQMPQDAHGLTEKPSALQARLKKNELVLPDTEVLRQLILEKVQIAEQLQTMPKGSRGLQMPSAEFSIRTEKHGRT